MDVGRLLRQGDWAGLEELLKHSSPKQLDEMISERLYGNEEIDQQCTFLSYVVRHDPPADVFLKLNSAIVLSGHKCEYDRTDWGGWAPIHYAMRWTSHCAVAAAFLANSRTENLTLACTVYGRTPRDYLEDVRLADAPNTDAIRLLLEAAIADHEQFKAMHEPKVERLDGSSHATTGFEYYKTCVERDPSCLLRRDRDGYTLLERARANDEATNVVAFVEQKTEVAIAVREGFPGSSDEEFNKKFRMWFDL